MNHFGYGAATGALYGALAPLVPTKTSTLNHATLGAVYGVGIWAASDMGWVPALDATFAA